MKKIVVWSKRTADRERLQYVRDVLMNGARTTETTSDEKTKTTYGLKVERTLSDGSVVAAITATMSMMLGCQPLGDPLLVIAWTIHRQTQDQGEGSQSQGQGVVQRTGHAVDPLDTARRPSGIVPVQLYSVKVHNIKSGKLVAGELGHMVRCITGFSCKDGAGSVQLAVLGRRLEQCGFDLWDMGMDMDYKERLGAFYFYIYA